jgi:hypothetical protein
MSSILLSGDTSGSVTVTVPAVAGTNTVTIPAVTGTAMVSGNMPAFSAYAVANTTIANNTFTKITFDTEEFDTNNNFASSRFTPTVAGYYQVSSQINITGTTGNNYLVSIYKNGAEFKRGTQITANPVGNDGLVISSLIYCNGSTDYLEIYGYQSSGLSQTLSLGSPTNNWFQAVMVRSA